VIPLPTCDAKKKARARQRVGTYAGHQSKKKEMKKNKRSIGEDLWGKRGAEMGLSLREWGKLEWNGEGSTVPGNFLGVKKEERSEKDIPCDKKSKKLGVSGETIGKL